MKKINVISCIATCAIMALIFFFSSQTATVSSGVSGGLTRRIAELIARIFNAQSADGIYSVLHVIVRKMAHFALYFLLGFSVANTVFRLFAHNGIKLIFNSTAFSIFYAITDELHQIFVPGRAFMFRDILIDSLGALSGAAVFLATISIYLRRKNV